MKRIFFFFLVLFLASSCSSKKEDHEDPSPPPAEVLYNEGLDELRGGSAAKAIETFEEIDKYYPFSRWTPRSLVMISFAYYTLEEYDTALPVLDRFISLHPGNKDIAYAYYLRSLCYYEQISDVKRDQKATEDALRAFDDVLMRFPRTPYAKDVKYKKELTETFLAGKEMEIGRFYYGRKYYLAALNRFKEVVERYQKTAYTPEALLHMTELYILLGMPEEAKKSAAVLGYNFPSSSFYEKAYDLIQEEPQVL